MPNAMINGIDLHWQSEGSGGEPLVLVHGSWGDHHVWDEIVHPLARSFRVLTYDRRGHSLSARPESRGSVHEDVADLAALIEHCDLGPAHILGNSFGGVIALRLASERPDLFRSLQVHEPPAFGVVHDPAVQASIVAAQERVRGVVDLLERDDLEEGARLFMDTVAFGPGAWAQMSAEDRRTFVANAPTFIDEERDGDSRTVDVVRLARFAKPTLLTQGDQSQPFFPIVLDELARVLPMAERRTFAGVGHVPQRTHPTEYVAVIESFLR